MSKDPAVLFYSSDFLTGTYTMSNEHIGMYIRLLCLQHQKGRLTEKDMINVCLTYVEDVYCKFIKDENGLYYNERMENETNRRRLFCESRRKSRMSNVRGTHVPRMETETITSVCNDVPELSNQVIKDTVKAKFVPPTLEEVTLYAKSRGNHVDSTTFFDFFNASGWVDSKGKPVLNWKQKYITWESRSDSKVKQQEEKKERAKWAA